MSNKKPSPKTVTMAFRIKKQDHTRLVRAATKQNRTISNFVLTAILEKLGGGK